MKKGKADVPTAKEFENWLEDYHDMIYATIYRLTLNEDDALDLTQDVFLRAYRKRKTFRGDASPSTWLTRIALNHTYNFLKREKSAKWQEMVENDHESEQGAEKSASLSFHQSHLEALSPLERAVVSARIYEELPYKKIAETLDTSENSAKAAWSKAVKKLRERMK